VRDLSQKREKMTVLKRFESKSVTTCIERGLQNLFSPDNDIKKECETVVSNNITLSKVTS
jgi:hypothetical protein